MKRFVIAVAFALCVIVPSVAYAQNQDVQAMKLKSLKIKKEKLQKELEDLEKDWSRPRANLTEEDLASMKTQYDSLSLDLKSAILTLDIEIEELSQTGNK